MIHNNMIRFVSLISGSSGNSTLFTDGETTILIDCGMSGINLTEKLEELMISPEEIDGVFITHEHTDHIKGVGVIARKYKLPVYGTEKTLLSMNVGKIASEQINIINPYEKFSLGSLEISSFSIPHDANDPIGYSIYADGKKYTLATDIGSMPDKLLGELMGSEKIIFESNHDIEMLKYGSYPYQLKRRILSDIGHLSNDLSAETSLKLADSGTKAIMLAHLSHENNTPEIAKLTTSSELKKRGFNDVSVLVADRYKTTEF